MVSLFSGCGGLDLGLSRAGFRHLLANEIDESCIGSLNSNFPGVPVFDETVANLSAEKALELTDGMASRGHVDLVAGGPPCPPFSKSRFYRKDKPRALTDPHGWETINGFLSVVESLRPRAVLFENVHGFAYKVHADALNLLVSRLEGFGYTCTREVLNAANYGVPQIRERFFLIGSLEGACQLPGPTHQENLEHNLFSPPLKPWVTAGEAIGDLDTEENADDTGHFAGGKHHDLLKEIPPGDNYLFFTEKRGHPNPLFEWRSRYWSFLLKLSFDLPSWTIQARRSNNMGPLHWRNRILRIAEIKRLQTFPDEWVLEGKVEQQWRQVGNAVPPVLAEALGRAIAQHLSAAKEAEGHDGEDSKAS